MKPCLQRKKALALLGLGELDSSATNELRAHMETCAGCRGYWEEMKALGQRLTALESGQALPASESFHCRVMREIQGNGQSGRRAASNFLPRLRPIWLAAAAALVVGLVWMLHPRGERGMIPPAKIAVAAASPHAREMAPSLANYQSAADRSLEELDAMLNRQASRPIPSAPVYTAAMIGRGGEGN